MAVCALFAGILGSILARAGSISLLEPLYSAVPRTKHIQFLADAWAHAASYLAGILGGCTLVVGTWISRRSVQAGR
jgi:hypothetical protein